MSRSQAVKRLMRELKDLEKEPPRDFVAMPLEDDIFIWHFSIRGPADGGFKGGKYHGKIVFPHDYPMKPPNITFLSPSGRFEVGKKICLTITGYHPEHWHPVWGIHTAMIALIAFFPTKSEGAIAGIDCSPEVRADIAKKSRSYKCEVCGINHEDILPDLDESESAAASLPVLTDENNNPLKISLELMSPDKNSPDKSSPDKSSANVTSPDVDGNSLSPQCNIFAVSPSTLISEPQNGGVNLFDADSVLHAGEINQERGLSLPSESQIVPDDKGKSVQEIPSSETKDTTEADEAEDKEVKEATADGQQSTVGKKISPQWHIDLTRRVVKIRALRSKVKTLQTELTLYIRIIQLSGVGVLFALFLYMQM